MKILDVPHIATSDTYCVPDSASMLFSYLGKPMRPDEIALHLRGSEDDGFYTVDIVHLARKLGFRGRTRKNRQINDIIQLIDTDVPVVTSVLSAMNPFEAHCIVVHGYDDGNLFVRDPENARTSLSFNEFDSMWSLFDRDILYVRR